MSKTRAQKILAIDVGGTHVKILASGETQKRKFESGPTLTPDQMVAGVKQAAEGWKYDVISIGFPAPVVHDQPVEEPIHLGTGWVKFDFKAAFGCPVKIINDAAMQALGSYEGGTMLFLGLGTGLGTAMIIEGVVKPMELGHLPYRKGTYEGYVGTAALERLGRKKWRKLVHHVVPLLTSGLLPDYVVLGGGNVRELKELPPLCRLGQNENAFTGGFRLWQSSDELKAITPKMIQPTNDILSGAKR
jgi:polyphosphate glucokinase